MPVLLDEAGLQLDKQASLAPPLSLCSDSAVAADGTTVIGLGATALAPVGTLLLDKDSQCTPCSFESAAEDGDEGTSGAAAEGRRVHRRGDSRNSGQ